MRTIQRSSAFKKDFKRVSANPKYTKIVQKRLKTVLGVLCGKIHPLPESFRDHELTGNWHGFRECHLKPDLLLIYRRTSDGLKLQLARIESHSELFE